MRCCILPPAGSLILTVGRIFEITERTASSLFTSTIMGPLTFMFISPFYFWRSPAHLFFTYILPIVPAVFAFDGLISSLRTRTPEEVLALVKKSGVDADGWNIRYGRVYHAEPIGSVTWIIGTKS